MKWLLTLLVGMIIGAGALFVYLREFPDAPPPAPALAVAPSVAAPALPAPAPVQAPAPAPEAAQAAAVPQPADNADAASGKLLVPVEGVQRGQLSDSFGQARGAERQHEALDIMAPKGTKVLAVADGKVAKLFNSNAGGLTVYQFDPSDTYAYYYAHLDRYADGLKEGAPVKRGDVLGYVGVSGNSDPNAPHLHFAVFELTPSKEWWKGRAINPYPLLRE